MELTLASVLTNLMVGFFIGAAIGLTGIGGGVLIIPSLIHIIKIPPVSAIGTGLFFSLLTRIIAIIEHSRQNTIRKRTAVYFIIGSAPSVIASSYAVNYLSKVVDKAKLDHMLQIGIFAIISLTCVILIAQTVFRKEKAFYAPRSEFSLKRKLGGILFGILVGILIGTTSIGGGVFIIPILIIFFNLSARDTVGTSIIITFVLALLGSTVYLLSGNVILPVAILMATGSIAGVSLGSCGML